MPSAQVEAILAAFRKHPDALLELPRGLSDADLAALAASSEVAAVKGLRVSGSRDTDWNAAGVGVLAAGLPGLVRLDLSNSPALSDAGIQTLAANFTNLQVLDLSYCTQVTDVGVGALAANLTCLHTLDLTGCKQVTNVGVDKISNSLGSINELNLNYCSMITDAGVKALAVNLTNLRALRLRYCTQVTDAGVQALANLTRLHTLDLGYIRVLDPGAKALATNLLNLRALSLAYCTQVTNAGVQVLADNLTNLRTLDFTYCTQITVLPESVGRLHHLEELVLGGTGLTALPKALRELPRLRWLDVQNVPGLELPAELRSKPANPRAILDYLFRSTVEEMRTLNEAKLILVGNEDVGKTSLVNFLAHDKPCSSTSKTPGVAIIEGVDVTRWDVTPDAAGDTPLRLNVWDFGGQQVLYETHQFFLTARSLYLIVLSARKENETEQEANLISWLRSIRTRTVEEVPVIVVINKTEPPQELQIDESRLRREFPAIKRFVRTSCRDPQQFPGGGVGIPELRCAIVEVIRAELPHVRDQFPLSSFNIKEQLAVTARRSSILNTDTYRQKCAAEQVTDPREQENLLDLLHRIGVVVKYDDTTLLDPNWLTTAVYRVLTHAEVIKSGGEFATAKLGPLLTGLPEKKYPPGRWPFIAEMMERFGLSFRIQGTDRYLVPNQFSVEEPPLPGWGPADVMFQYAYQDTPSRGLLPRFVVLMHQHLTRPRVAWLHGVVLSVQGCTVLVKMEPHRRVLSVLVRGPVGQRRAALATVREHFTAVHTLNNLAPGKDVFAQVPVPVPGAPDAVFSYEFLEACERRRIPDVPHTQRDVVFNVRELLDGVGPEPVGVRVPGAGAGPGEWDTGGTVRTRHGPVTVIVGNVGVYYGSAPVYALPPEVDMSVTDVGAGGDIVGAAIGPRARVRAQSIERTGNQQARLNSEEWGAVLTAARALLALTPGAPDARERAEAAVGLIEGECAKPDPDGERVRGWLADIGSVSAPAAGVLRSAAPVAALVG